MSPTFAIRTRRAAWGFQQAEAAAALAGREHSTYNSEPLDVTYEYRCDMDKLLFHAAVFALFTLLVYFVCMWFVRVEERHRERRRREH